MDPETSGVGAPRQPGLRVGRHQRRARRRGRGGNRRDRQACARRQRCHTKDESAQVRQERRHGRVDVPERGLCPAQHQGPLLFGPDIRKSITPGAPLSEPSDCLLVLCDSMFLTAINRFLNGSESTLKIIVHPRL